MKVSIRGCKTTALLQQAFKQPYAGNAPGRNTFLIWTQQFCTGYQFF